MSGVRSPRPQLWSTAMHADGAWRWEGGNVAGNIDAFISALFSRALQFPVQVLCLGCLKLPPFFSSVADIRGSCL